MGDDLIPILTRFHQEVLLPDVKRIVSEAVGNLEAGMNAHFDEIYKRFGSLEAQYHLLVAGLKRVEERLDRVEGRLDRVEQKLDAVEKKLEKVALRSELEALKARVDGLAEQVRTLEARLDA